MDLSLSRPGEPPAAAALATWSCAGTTVHLLPDGAGDFTVRELRVHGDAPAAALQVVLFAGPRDAAQQHADDLADRRIAPAVEGVPGLAGWAVAVAADGARLVVGFAAAPEVFDAVQERIFATDLLPEEDPALLTGPDRADVHLVAHASHDLRDLPAVVTS